MKMKHANRGETFQLTKISLSAKTRY